MVYVNYDIHSDILSSSLSLSVLLKQTGLCQALVEITSGYHIGNEGRLNFQNDNKIIILYLFNKTEHV
jgi:hypothetical protein